MAPIGEDVHLQAKDAVAHLEARVKALEEQIRVLSGGTPKASTEEVRMILMGPPGAGKLTVESLSMFDKDELSIDF